MFWTNWLWLGKILFAVCAWLENTPWLVWNPGLLKFVWGILAALFKLAFPNKLDVVFVELPKVSWDVVGGFGLFPRKFVWLVVGFVWFEKRLFIWFPPVGIIGFWFVLAKNNF